MIATLTSKGQLTLPKPVRDRLKLRSGDRLDCVVCDDGIIQIVPLKQSAAKLRGILPKPAKPVTIKEMNDAIAKGASAHDRD
ncbi:MAG: AbrB/MazE/SpoVT family DNA-binding domain-containing protein [Lentisphaeria bacterium]|nr:AbrB/MazE/SpoVT family DNA-binding domain-containing protein [Lentisphaeria bacterium]